MHNNFHSSAHTVAHRHNGPQRYHHRHVKPSPTLTARRDQLQQQGCQSKPVVWFLIFIATLLALAMGVLR